MNRRSRVAARERAESAQAQRRARARALSQNPVPRPRRRGEPALAELLTQPSHPQWTTARRLALRTLTGRAPDPARVARMADLAASVDRRKRGLVHVPEWWAPLWTLAGQPWFDRTPADYTPPARTWQRRVHALIRHMVVRWPVPTFLYDAFAAPRSPFVRLFLHLTHGGSMKLALQMGLLPAALTRRQCHLFLTSPGGLAPASALRRAQLLGMGGSLAQARAVVDLPSLFVRLGTRAQEQGMDRMLRWMVSVQVRPGLVRPLTEFLHGRCADPRFRLQGRTVASVTRMARQAALDASRTHTLAELRSQYPEALPQSAHAGGHVSGAWFVRQIRTLDDLAQEGQRMEHCVLGYGREAALGRASIWSLTLDGLHQLTIEVREPGRVVQVRGKHNRPPTSSEIAVLRRWARAQALTIQGHAW